MRQAINKPAAVRLAGILVDRDIADHGVWNDRQVSCVDRVRQQQVGGTRELASASSAAHFRNWNAALLGGSDEPLHGIAPGRAVFQENAIG